MLKYKFNVGEALERAGLNMYKCKNHKSFKSKHP